VEGTVFNIKRYAIHDGPGIRTTVFLKGCPLSCPWCQNPEGVSPRPEVMWRAPRCIACGDCEKACPTGALSFREGPVIDRDLCDVCGLCAAVCHAEALEIVGLRLTVDEVMAEVVKDRIFYDESGGGVTISGGEPLMQPDFLGGILEASKQAGLHTALDTSGYAERDTLLRIADYVDLFLWDLKIMDDAAHLSFTGVSNQAILDNLKSLARLGKQVVIRFSLVPGVNDNESNIEAMAGFVASLENVGRIDILPYHRVWMDKYRGLKKGERPFDADPPSPETLEAAETRLAGYGLKTRRGG
jgi:pyruvate formate lyase activating enzyme